MLSMRVAMTGWARSARLRVADNTFLEQHQLFFLCYMSPDLHNV